MTQEQKTFIERVGKHAAADMIKSRILASLTIAQAILESGWGKSGLTVKANAIFGIKATSSWKGKVFNTKTQECYDGVTFTTVDTCFRAYSSWDESITDHCAFLTGVARYAAVIGEQDYKKACNAIKAAGYATDPEYPAKLIKIIEQYELTAYDAKETNGGKAMNIIQDFIPAGRKNRPGRANPMKYITVHNTGNTSKGAGIKNHAAYIKSDAVANAPVSWHYTVDETGAYQHIPDNEDAFHAGDGAGNGNRQSIGIEICMNSDGNILGATDNAAELVASLCKKHNIAVENIKQHYDWTKKDCPQMIRSGKPYNWSAFIGKVKDFIGTSTAAPSTPAPIPSQPAAFSPYTVKVTADVLNIRKGLGTNYAANGDIKDKGIYTIVEESDGAGAKKWGKLKSGAGWISLDYTQKR